MQRSVQGTAIALLVIAIGGLAYPIEAQAARDVLRMRLDGPMAEAPSDAAGFMALLEERELNTFYDRVSGIRKAARDPDIAGLVLIIEQPQLSFAHVDEFTDAIKEFKAKNKPVYCYLDYAGNLSYALATAADHITIAENSVLSIEGLHAELSFYKGLLDKIGVEAQMLHCGAYKSALEPFTRTSPSPEAVENVNWLLDGLYERWVSLIAENRGLGVDEVKRLIDSSPLMSAEAREAKLIDEVSSFPAFKKRMLKEFGSDATFLKRYEEGGGIELDTDNPFTLFVQLMQLFEPGTESAAPRVGLVYVDGMITVGQSDDGPFGGSAGSTSVRSALEQAREDDDIRAVVLRVSSPGGSAVASDIIWDAARRCGEEKPLIVSMGSVAGSGGYYVSIPADTIFADPSTITASIGVVGGKFVWKELMEEKLGITTTEFKRGARSDLMTFNRHWTAEEEASVQELLNKIYVQFKGRILESRGDRLKKDLEEIAGGRVFTGAQALELGLVDELGGLNDALDFAARKAGLGSNYEVRIVPRPSDLAHFVNVMQKLSGKDQHDEFEIRLRARLLADPLVGGVWPLLRELAPQQLNDLLRHMHNLTILHRERVGCFMPFVPRIR